MKDKRLEPVIKIDKATCNSKLKAEIEKAAAKMGYEQYDSSKNGRNSQIRAYDVKAIVDKQQTF